MATMLNGAAVMDAALLLIGRQFIYESSLLMFLLVPVDGYYNDDL